MKLKVIVQYNTRVSFERNMYKFVVNPSDPAFKLGSFRLEFYYE